MAQPEPNAGSIVGACLTGGALAGDEHEHVALLVVTEAHLPDLPLGLARLNARVPRGRFGAFDALRLHHLLQADYQGLDLRLLAGQGQNAARAAGEEEEVALPGLADRGDSDLVDRVELENGHRAKGSVRY